MSDPRQLAGAALAAALVDSRQRTLAWTLDLSDEHWRPPPASGVNPLAWELAHVAWFAEFFALRGSHRSVGNLLVADQPPRHAGPDALLDSARLPHAARWTAPLPSRERVVAMLGAQLDDSLNHLGRLPDGAGDDALYFHRLALFHEDMHAEATAWMRSALGCPAPAGLAPLRPVGRGRMRAEGGAMRIGWPASRSGFAFDNEREGHESTLAAFDIDCAPLAAGDFLRFVEAGGYADVALWPGAAGDWLARCGRRQPLNWRRTRASESGWEVRWFDRWLPLDPALPLVHVNAWEAEAYCRWAGRRLPSAAEWESAATAGHPRFEWGHGVWEWTADAFLPYPGFRAGPYADYSAPWFGSHRELRGGAFATHPRLHDVCYRNFFLPDRADIFSGFRTASVEA